VSLGQRIKQRREILKITQQELAQALGMTPQNISLIEKDKSTPSLAVVSRLAEQLGASIDYLVCGKEGVSTDIIPAIKADKILSLDAKRALITMVKILREASSPTIDPRKDTL
jgi:transcriptional regulator with XRE-family HTH domain